MRKWTPAQQHAIEARNKNILVSAAAGSGKTAVLVERVVGLITDEHHPIDIDKLLVVTFTNAAAAEMKNRIAAALSECLRAMPNNTNIIRQISLLPNAKICTIDSFCIHLVRENFFRLNIAQDFSVLENAQQLLIEEKALETVIEAHYEQEDTAFRALVELLSDTKNDKALINAVKQIENYIAAQPFPFEWLNCVKELYHPNIPFADTAIYQALQQELQEYIAFAEQILTHSREALYEGDALYEKYSAMLQADEDIFTLLASLLDDWDALKTQIQHITFSAMPYQRGYTSDAKQTLSSNRALYKSVVADIQALMCATQAEIREDNAYLYPIVNTLFEVTKEYHETMFEMKKEAEAFSFSDIEHFAIELLFKKDEQGVLVPTALAQDYRAQFYEILVDEYQDTNAAQDTLFAMLSNGHNRFMVGDVKQSIYRFRLAMPQIFNEKKERYLPYGTEGDHQKIILDKNFRSREGICAFTNFLFSKLMSRRIGEMVYTKEEYLNAGADYPESQTPCAQLHLVETPDGEDIDEYEAHQAAALILKKIKQKEQVNENGVMRPITYGDFAVLFRSTKKAMPAYAKVFAEYGIPVIANNRMNLFENNEVSILISFLRVMDNPTQDIPLLATLMSVFYGYSAEQIATAKVKSRATHLYAVIADSPEIFSDFLRDFQIYRQYAASMSVENFLRRIMSDTAYLSLIAAMGNYEQRKLNVMKFVDMAKNFDKGENVGLTAFVRYIDSMMAADVEVESADMSGIGGDCVQLMSVHKSKGLEFPAVILGGSAHTYNQQELSAPILFHHQLGIGLKVNHEEGMYRYPSMQYTCIKNLNSCAAMSENLRVLYVAVTRAKEQFIIFSSFRNVERRLRTLSERIVGNTLYPGVLRKAQSDADLLLMCALLHRDGGVLRKQCAADIQPDVNSAAFEWQIVNTAETFSIEEETPVSVMPDEKIVAQIREKLSFTYERKQLSAYAAKRTASALDEKQRNYRYFAESRPAFLAKDGVTAAEKGTALHAFMQYCDYHCAKQDLENEIKRLQTEGLLSEKQVISLNRETLTAFFESDLAARMLNAAQVWRELKVSAFVPVNTLEKTDYTDKVLVQGIADCVFEEEGALVLVDYKTDYVTSENALLEAYHNQLSFYRLAVEQRLNRPVKETMLYSFYLSKPCIYK